MPTVADALRQHAPAYLAKFGEAVPLGHRKVISAITRCRTGELGGVAYRCDDCGRVHWFGRSCGNRHCPGCGAEKTTAWLAKQTSRLLPVQHFLVTCTVPDRIGSVRCCALSNARAITRCSMLELTRSATWAVRPRACAVANSASSECRTGTDRR